MTELLGNVGLCLAVLTAAAALLASLAATRGFERALPAARLMIGGVFVTLTAASAALVYGLLRSDFAIQYIAGYSERALPLGYKLAAFWAGQEGSLLLWAWLVVEFVGTSFGSWAVPTSGALLLLGFGGLAAGLIGERQEATEPAYATA